LARTGFHRFTSCISRICPDRRRISFKHLAGQVRMDLEPGRIGFMSTQRRENRWQRTSCTLGAGASRVPGDRSASPGWRVSGHATPAPIAQYDRAYANGGTAPPRTSAWLATNSLQSDRRTIKLVKPVRFVPLVPLVPFFSRDIRHSSHSSPPSGAALRAATGTLATHRSSLPHIPSSSGFVCLHPTLPRFPAGKRRWTERYDGKRDLHLQHAA
jgi:hypothetical protein